MVSLIIEPQLASATGAVTAFITHHWSVGPPHSGPLQMEPRSGVVPVIVWPLARSSIFLTILKIDPVFYSQ
jgi:hypothetical protein